MSAIILRSETRHTITPGLDEVCVFSRSEDEKKHVLSLGTEWVGGYGDKPLEPPNAAVTFAPVGEVVIAALQACDRRAIVAINAIHLNHILDFLYDDLWWERFLASIPNYIRSRYRVSRPRSTDSG